MQLQAVFSDLLSRVTTTAGHDLWTEIITHYNNGQRHYHNLTHLENMYNEFENCNHLIEDKGSMFFALFYHDIIYNAAKKNNEEKSAALAVLRLTEIKYPEDKILLCRDMILATKKHEVTGNNDIDLFTDADLAILGSTPQTYINYYSNIRKEYALYPDFLYNPGRKKVLLHFLEMESIFKTEFFKNKYESAARNNILSEIEVL